MMLALAIKFQMLCAGPEAGKCGALVRGMFELASALPRTALTARRLFTSVERRRSPPPGLPTDYFR